MPSLEPNVEGGVAFFYPKPNPALSEILLGQRLQDVTSDWTHKVAVTYVTKLAARPHFDDRHPGALEAGVDAEVFVGGYENDRWVGEISDGGANSITYALADEYGRHDPSPGQRGSTTQGHHDLADSLYEHLPPI